MIRWAYCISTIMLLMLVAGCNGPNEPYVEPSPGHAVFLNHCVGCHAGLGNPPGPNGQITGSLKMSGLAMFEAYLRNPNNSRMPAFNEARLSSEDVTLLYDYLAEEVDKEKADNTDQ